MNTQSGLARIILIVVIVIIVLSIFRVSLRDLAGSSIMKDNFSFAWAGITYIWNNFLGSPIIYIFNFFKEYVWETSLESWQRIKNGVAPRMFNEDAPGVMRTSY